MPASAGRAGIIASVDVPSELLRQRRRAIIDLLTRHGANDVRVFSSVARGDDEPDGDIDLLVAVDGESSPGGELLEVLELSELLSALVGARVDVVTARFLRSEVRNLALAEAIPL